MKSILITMVTVILAASLHAQEAYGTWTKKSHRVQGTWKIENSQVALENLSTKSAPDLKIFVSPLSVDQLNNKNATKGAQLVAVLKSSKGSQTYALPKGLDLTKYKSIIIHCQRYSKLWGAAAL